MRYLILLLPLIAGCNSRPTEAEIERRIQERELELYIEREAMNRLRHHTPGPVTFQSVLPEHTPEEEAYFIEHGKWPESSEVEFPIDIP